MNIFNNIYKRNRVKPAICYFCYHKVGTVLLGKIFRKICKEKKWKFTSKLGYQCKIKLNSEITSFGHSLLDIDCIKSPFVGFHLIRDPRDIIVSGYLYHLRTSEKWCVNEHTSYREPIRFPLVPYSQQHRNEIWKINYLKSLNGKSYQENIRSISQDDGLLFEMKNYGMWTIQSMNEWDYERAEILEVKFETIMENFESEFIKIFRYIGINESDIDHCLSIAVEHDIGKKSEEEINAMSHVYSKNSTKWKDYFKDVHKELFKEKFGDILIHLGYENDNNW